MLFFSQHERGIPLVPYLTYDVYYPYYMFKTVRFIEQTIDKINGIDGEWLVNKWNPVIISDIGYAVTASALYALARSLELQSRFNKGGVNTVINDANQQYALPLIRRIFGTYPEYSNVTDIKPTYPVTTEMGDFDSKDKIVNEMIIANIHKISEIEGCRGLLLWFHEDKLTVFK